MTVSRGSKTVKIKKKERESDQYVSRLLVVLSVLLARSSQDTNHTPKLGCLVSIYTTV